jgi:pyrimidine-nucleoside phosphorylase
MSKKIAAGAQRIVLDVKVGVGAFMHSLDDARALAESMVEIARLAGRQSVALLSDMNQPLGSAVGNALEVKEAIETLHGGGPEDFREHCLEVAAHILVLGEAAASEQEARQMIEKVLADGTAWEHFRKLVTSQGGDVAYVDDPARLPSAKLVETVSAPHAGYLTGIHAQIVGETSVELGAGRARKGDPINHAVGILIHHKVGDKIEKDQPLFTIHADNEDLLANARDRLLEAHTWSDQPVEPLPLFYGVVKQN